MHKKRSEHWVVVNGIASVTIGQEVSILKAGESTYVDIGVVHSLENKTNTMLEIIEVQNGVYLGEDDIVRFDDEYGRN
jgi:mannose-6-phosphate isomerase-like protein (cupin superfamily)